MSVALEAVVYNLASTVVTGRQPRVPDQNGISQLYNMLEIYHSGPEQCFSSLHHHAALSDWNQTSDLGEQITEGRERINTKKLCLVTRNKRGDRRMAQ